MGKITIAILKRLLPIIPSNKVEFSGKVLLVSPISIKLNSTVITPDGIGEVRVLYRVNGNLQKAEVYLYRGYIKSFRALDLLQYVVYHQQTKQFILLSPIDYTYIYRENQPVEYRVTSKLYAHLTKKSKSEYEYVRSLNKTRYGTRFLRVLSNQNIEIKKKY